LKQKQINISASTIGRILKRKGLINKKVSIKRYKAAKNPRKRFPHGFKVSDPGDMIQMDTKYITIIGGRKIYQFAAIDVLSKKRVLRIYSSFVNFLLNCNFLEYKTSFFLRYPDYDTTFYGDFIRARVSQ
jgi:hypothetical protein